MSEILDPPELLCNVLLFLQTPVRIVQVLVFRTTLTRLSRNQRRRLLSISVQLLSPRLLLYALMHALDIDRMLAILEALSVQPVILAIVGAAQGLWTAGINGGLDLGNNARVKL